MRISAQQKDSVSGTLILHRGTRLVFCMSDWVQIRVRNSSRQRRIWQRSGTWGTPWTVVHNFVISGRPTNFADASGISPCMIGSNDPISGRLVGGGTTQKTTYANIQASVQNRIIRAPVKVVTWSSGPAFHRDGGLVGHAPVVPLGGSTEMSAFEAAGKVLTRPIPSYAMAPRNPARVIRMRFEQHVVGGQQDVVGWAWPTGSERRNRDSSKWTYPLRLLPVSP